MTKKNKQKSCPYWDSIDYDSTFENCDNSPYVLFILRDNHVLRIMVRLISRGG